MHKLSAAVACAALVLTGVSAAVAGTTGNGWQQRAAAAKAATVTVGLGPENHRVIVEFGYDIAAHKTTIASYAYNPANGNVNQLPSPEENANPTSGIGVVVKCPPPKGPCSAATRTVPLTNGVGSLSPFMPEAGTYTVVVTVQANAINKKGTGAPNRTSSGASMTTSSATKALPAHTMLLTFDVVVDSKGNMTMDPKLQPTATVAPGSGTASQQ